MEPTYPISSPAVAVNPELAKAYLNKVYLWMAVSLLLTAGTAVYTAKDPELMLSVMNHQLLFFIGYIAVVLVMSFGRNALSAGALSVLLMVFAGLTGCMFGPLLCAYTQQSLGLTFGVTAGTFGAMALWGACTKKNLSGMGRTLLMLLFGLIIAGVVNIFWGNGLLDLICSAVGVVVFSLFTAYDTQRLLAEGLMTPEGEERSKGAVLGALTLYLDFINLFLYLLRFFGQSRD